MDDDGYERDDPKHPDYVDALTDKLDADPEHSETPRCCHCGKGIHESASVAAIDPLRWRHTATGSRFCQPFGRNTDRAQP